EEDGPVVVAVDVDEAGRDAPPLPIDFGRTALRDVAHSRDAIASNREARLEGRPSGSIDDRGVADHDIIASAHPSLLFFDSEDEGTIGARLTCQHRIALGLGGARDVAIATGIVQ